MNAEPALTRRRRVLVPAVAGVVLALSLSACAAGQRAQTAEQTPVQEGVNADVGSIGVRGANIVAPSGASYQKGSNARLSVVLVNNGSRTDRLIGVSSPAITSWSAFPTTAAADQAAGAIAGTSSSGGVRVVPIAPGERTSFGVPDATGGLVLLGLKKKLPPGTTVHMSFSFARAGTVSLPVPVGQNSNTSPPTITSQPSLSGSG